MIQYKSTNLEIKDLDLGKREVAAYFSGFNNEDSDGDIIRQGAFAKSLQERMKRIKHLYNHWDACGVFQRLEEDATGLFGVTKIGNHTLGNDVLAMYQDGIITEHSIGFETIQSRPIVTGEKTVNELVELRLWEGSSLDKWGANHMTPVMGVSAKNLEQYSTAIEALTKAIKNGKYTDETIKEFEIKLKNIQAFLKSLTEKEPLDNTPDPVKPIKIDLIKISKLITN